MQLAVINIQGKRYPVFKIEKKDEMFEHLQRLDHKEISKWMLNLVKFLDVPRNIYPISVGGAVKIGNDFYAIIAAAPEGHEVEANMILKVVTKVFEEHLGEMKWKEVQVEAATTDEEIKENFIGEEDDEYDDEYEDEDDDGYEYADEGSFVDDDDPRCRYCFKIDKYSKLLNPGIPKCDGIIIEDNKKTRYIITMDMSLSEFFDEVREPYESTVVESSFSDFIERLNKKEDV